MVGIAALRLGEELTAPGRLAVILRGRFASDEKTEGFRKDGPVSVAKFELGEGNEPEQREARALRQRQASDVIEQLLVRLADGSNA